MKGSGHSSLKTTAGPAELTLAAGTCFGQPTGACDQELTLYVPL